MREPVSAYVNVAGKFRAIPRPRSGQTWTDWLVGYGEAIPNDVWATCDGHLLPHNQVLTGEPMILRLHYWIRGGTKDRQRGEAIHKKLAMHLHEKGVPQETSADRATKVISTVGLQAVEAAYSLVEP